MIEMTRPTFLESLLEAWQANLKESRWNLVPYWLVLSFGAGVWTALSLPATYWNGSKLEVSVASLAGLLTLNGLILALSWSAFSKIYEIIGAGEFCAFLRRNKLLSRYLVFVGYVHIAQVLAIVATAFAMFALILPFAAWVMQVAVAASIGATAYAIKQGVGASTVMQDLIWQKAAFDHERPARAPVRGVSAAEAV